MTARAGIGTTGRRRRWDKGAGPCPREEAERRITDPEHPWYGRRSAARRDPQGDERADPGFGGAPHQAVDAGLLARGHRAAAADARCLDCSVSSPEQAERVAQLGCEAVELEVPMRVDLKFGRNWGDAKHTWAELHQGRRRARKAVDRPHARSKARTSTPAPASFHAVNVAIPQAAAETAPRLSGSPKFRSADLIGEQPFNGKIACPFHEDDTPSLHCLPTTTSLLRLRRPRLAISIGCAKSRD